MSWFISNLANIIVVVIVAALLGAAVASILRNRKKGIGACGYNCSACPHHGGCASVTGGMKKK